jgi:hypothetical protein
MPGFNWEFRKAAFRGFSGCGKTHSVWHEVSGHDFSRAEDSLESTRALAPEGRYSGVRIKSRPFSAACKAPLMFQAARGCQG